MLVPECKSTWGGYEKWAGKPRPKQYGLDYIGGASGYISGHTGTITLRLNAASLEEARRMFDKAIEDAGMVNLSCYNIVKKG